MSMMKGKKYGVTVKPKRDLTEEEADVVAKTLDLATSVLRLHLKDDVIVTEPNKNDHPKEHE